MKHFAVCFERTLVFEDIEANDAESAIDIARARLNSGCSLGDGADKASEQVHTTLIMSEAEYQVLQQQRAGRNCANDRAR